MFEKVIEFSSHTDYFNQEEDYPIPTKLNIPDWYKKLEHTVQNATIKGCMPFLDTLTSGYLLKMPQDLHIRHNVENNDGRKDSFQTYSMHNYQDILKAKCINLNSGLDSHSIEQLEGSPYIEKNKNLPFYKILNPWKIKTPKGYSCLFVPPLNNADDRFSIIPGIVDTDTFPNEVNFPIILNGDKYPILETTIQKGLPYVQIIPFKRDNWKMNVKKRNQEEIRNNKIFFNLSLLYRYKNNYWKKKIWK